MESAANIVRDLPTRPLYSSPSIPLPPLPRLLDELTVDRAFKRYNNATIATELETTRGRSPIAKLPDDLLQLIFRTYFEILRPTWTPQHLIRYSHGRLQAPFILSSVCRSWRMYTLASPKLWTYVVVPALVHGPSRAAHPITAQIKTGIERLSRRWIELIELLLARSGQAGLHVVIPKLHIRYLEPNVAKEFELYRNVVFALAPHRARIRSLCMSPDVLTSSAVWEIVGTPHVSADGTLNIRTPHLEYLELKTSGAVADRVHSSVLHLESPLLRVCTIEERTCLRLMQSHLVSLEVSLRANTPANWIQTLSSSARTLENLHLRILRIPEYFQLNLSKSRKASRKTVYPRLIHFGIASSAREPGTMLSDILESLSAPALRSARYEAIRPDVVLGSGFIRFAQYLNDPANGPVKELLLIGSSGGIILDVGDARTIAGHLPSVKTVTLSSRIDVAVGFIGAMHHLVPHIKICIKSADVLFPIGFPQEQLTVVMAARERENGTTDRERLAFFDTAHVNRDYDTVSETENIFPSWQYMIQVITDAVVVWRDGSIVGDVGVGEHPSGPRYQILPTRLILCGKR